MRPFVHGRLAGVALAVAGGFVVGLRLLDGVALAAFDGLALTALPAVAGGVCLWVAARRHASARAWRLLGGSCLAWAAGGAVRAWLELVAGISPFPSLADVGYLASYPLAAAAMLSFPTAPDSTAGRTRVLLDAVIVTAALLFCSWALVLAPAYAGATGSVLAQAITLAYPLGDLAVAVVAVLVMTRAELSQRVPLGLVTAGLLAAAVADSGFAALIANGTYATGHLIDLGWVVGYLLIIAAAVTPVDDRGADARDREPLWHLVLPYLPVGGVIVIVVGQGLAGRPLTSPLLWTAAVLLVALGARQIAALTVNRALVDQLRARETYLAHQLLHDPLTGLANRTRFDDRVSHALARRARGPVAVLYYDLDDFKDVNDTLGHHAGDQLLCAVARRLHITARAGDTVARLGGDEFAVLLDDPADRPAAIRRAERILAIAETPYDLDGHPVAVTGSIGIAVAVADDNRGGGPALLRRADAAMYIAKAAGKAAGTPSTAI